MTATFVQFIDPARADVAVRMLALAYAAVADDEMERERACAELVAAIDDTDAETQWGACLAYFEVIAAYARWDDDAARMLETLRANARRVVEEHEQRKRRATALAVH